MEEQEIRELIQEIIEEGESELSDWERNFLADIEVKLNERMILSPYQVDKIKQIHDKIFG